MKTYFSLASLFLFLASCGPNKEERISILKTKVERVSELNKSYKDSLDKIISLQVQKLTYYKDSILVYRESTFEPNVDTTAFAMSLHVLDSANTNRLAIKIAETDKELNEAKKELDNLLNIK
jgi:hypothetical protein